MATICLPVSADDDAGGPALGGWTTEGSAVAHQPNLYHKGGFTWGAWTNDRRGRPAACYYASIIDTQYGRLPDCLESSGQLEDTIVILTIYHGKLLGSHGRCQYSDLRYAIEEGVPQAERHPETCSHKHAIGINSPWQCGHISDGLGKALGVPNCYRNGVIQRIVVPVHLR